MIYSEVYNEGTAILSKAGITEAALDARLLLEHICDTDRNTLLAHPDREVSELEYTKYQSLIARRAKHIPLQHLTGYQEFMGLMFTVSEDVLIPRQDTEFVVEEGLRYIEDGMSVLDICTGSGCIILSIMNYKNDIYAVACDISDKALEIAKANARELGLSPIFKQGNLYEALDDEVKVKYDVIISNPPYIRSEIIDTLMPEVKNHDPYIALDGGADGLDFYRAIIENAPKYMTNYGRIILEIGHDQAEEVSALLADGGFSDISVVKDYAGMQRVATAVIKY